MGVGLGVAIAAAILVLLPLGAVWASHHWRDPPPDKWGVDRSEAFTPELAEYRVRMQFGLREEARWAAVRDAVTRGLAAPEDLRPAARAYATDLVAALDRVLQSRETRRFRIVRITCAILAVAVAVGATILGQWKTAAVYGLYLGGLSVLHGPWPVRRRRDRAAAALAENT